MHSWSIEHNVAAFSELELYAGSKGHASKPSTMSNCANKLLTPAAMVNNLAEMIDGYPLNQGH